MENKLQKPIMGIIPPLVTPLLDNDTLDIEGLERLIEHIISGGVHGIFILGTTGEFAGLSYKLRKKLIEQTCQLVNGRIPVLVGITDSAFDESLNLAIVSSESGADAVVMSPPYYYASVKRNFHKIMLLQKKLCKSAQQFTAWVNMDQAILRG